VPIDIASYRRWEGGRARSTPLAALAIASTMVRRRMKFKIVRIIVFAFTLISTGLAALVFYLHLQGQGDPMIQQQIRQLGFENVNLLAILNRLFDGAIGFWAFLLAAIVGAPVIAEDRRARALPLYFSRPIGHLDYVLGKAASAAFFLALLLILPRVAMYAIEVAFSEAEGVAWRQLPTLLRSCAAGALGVALLTSLSLGVSSLTERPTYAALFLLGLGVITTGVSFFLAEVLDNFDWIAVSPYACVYRLALHLVPVPGALSEDTADFEKFGVPAAWAGLGLWTALGLGALVLRIRRVEVVT
jgi:ABC-2 type transport system permease protein